MQLKRRIAVAVILATIFLAGCDLSSLPSLGVKPKKDFDQKVYRQNGLSFAHPAFWRITSDEVDSDGTRYITAEDSYSSIMSIAIAPEGMTYELDKAADDVIKGQADVPVLSFEQGKRTSASRTLRGVEVGGVRWTYTISLVGVEVPHSTDFFVIDIGDGRDALVQLQAADEDWPAADPEFQVIFDSIALEDKVVAEE